MTTREEVEKFLRECNLSPYVFHSLVDNRECFVQDNYIGIDFSDEGADLDIPYDSITIENNELVARVVIARKET